MDNNAVAYFSESSYIDNELIDQLLALCETEEDKQSLRRMGFVKNPYESAAGVLTMAERKVNLLSIERSFSTMEGAFISDVQALTEAKKKAYLKEMEKAIQDKDYAKLATLRPTADGEISKKYADTMKTMFETGKKTASDEMQVIAPNTDKDVQGLFRAQAIQMEDKINNEMAVTAQSEALFNIAKGVAVSVTLEQVEKALYQKLQKIVLASGTQAMGGAFNTWRVAVFEKYKDRVYGFQYTAVIDRRTTNFCLSLNGRVIGADDTDFYRLMPPNHTNCRSFWVEILKDEFIKPEIENIPDSIPRNRTGLTNFQDLQKIIPYAPKSAPTPEEARVQREGVLRMLVTDLRNKGLKLKPLAAEAAIAAPKVAEAAKYEKAKTLQELDGKAAAYFGNTKGSFKSFKDVELWNNILEAVHDVKTRIPALNIPELDIKNTLSKRGINATMSHIAATHENTKLTYNAKNILSTAQRTDILAERNVKNIQEYQRLIGELKAKPAEELARNSIQGRISYYESQIARLEKQQNVWTVWEYLQGIEKAKSTTYHELGHAVENLLENSYVRYRQTADETHKVVSDLLYEKNTAIKSLQKQAVADKMILSEYWKTGGSSETFAEAYASYMQGRNDLITPEVVSFFDKMHSILATYNP